MPPPHDRPEREKSHRDKGHDEFEFMAMLDAPRAAEYLTRIADGLRAGTVGLKADGRALRLAPAGPLRLELWAESKPEKGEGRLEVALRWRSEAPADEEALEIDPAPPVRAPEPKHQPAPADVL
jgi:amphi-Trp domain-containing protein